MNRMFRWSAAVLSGLMLLASCAEDRDDSYPGNTQNRALKAWMKQYRPELLENYQQDGDYYVDVVSLGDADAKPIRDTLVWVRYEITGRDLQGNICITRDSTYALQQGTFTPYTHYVPYYKYCPELPAATFREGVHLAMRNVLTLGEAYAVRNGFPREVELRKGAEVVLYLPATVVSTGEVNGDGGYEGQYALSENRPLIVRLKVTDRVKNPVAYEGKLVDEFAATNGGLDPTQPDQPDPEDVSASSSRAGEVWKIASTEAAQVYYNPTFHPGSDATGLFLYPNVYVGSQQKADELDRRINRALLERFGTEQPGERVDPEKTMRVWYIARFLDGFVQSTNIDEVKEIVYGEVETMGKAMSYNPSVNRDDQIAAWYYVLPYFRYGSWGALLTPSSSAYGELGIVGMTQTSTSTDASTYALMNYYAMMNNYYASTGYYGNYHDNYYDGYMNGLYAGSLYNSFNFTGTTTDTVVTEVLPYTPLLIEFYIEAVD